MSLGVNPLQHSEGQRWQQGALVMKEMEETQGWSKTSGGQTLAQNHPRDD